ncbi:MAG: tyrosine-type recombinase/integrase [Chloroflexi bacterium]|nr:tyrosine-type recombinase/integrase [Chloroflexota bacterium]
MVCTLGKKESHHERHSRTLGRHRPGLGTRPVRLPCREGAPHRGGLLSHAPAFFGRLGKTPDQVSPQEIFAWAHGVGLSGERPSPVTIGARLACLSAFYRFLIRMDMASANPCDRLERPRISPGTPRGLSVEEIKRLLAIIPDTPAGRRDRAIVLILTLTGRRRSEVFNLKAGDVSVGGAVYYSYRGKGGKRELPRPAYEAIQQALVAAGQDLAAMGPEESLWPSSGSHGGRGLTSGTFYGNLRRYLRQAGLPSVGVHIFRHSAAKLRREAGESVEEVSRFLDHSSLAVTTVYLRRLEGQEDRSWAKVAEVLGVYLASRKFAVRSVQTVPLRIYYRQEPKRIRRASVIASIKHTHHNA